MQKVNFDATLSEVVSMPLYFFNYVTQEAEELMDLKGYRLCATKHLNHFTIVATSEEDVEEFAAESFRLEITLTDALYSPPKAY